VQLGAILLKMLLECNSHQGNILACFVSLLLRIHVKEGMLVSKALSLIEAKAMASFAVTKIFKPISWAGINALCSLIYIGKDVAKAVKHAGTAYKSFQSQNSSTGQLESLLCLCCCEQQASSTKANSAER